MKTMTAEAVNELDASIARHVSEELDWDPRVLSDDVSVKVHDGVVTLTGFVNGYSQKIAAERAAQRVYGVRGVADDITVKPLLARTDPQVAEDVVHALGMRDDVPDGTAKVLVKDGWVTLDGRADWAFQRAAAESVARNVRGVKGVSNSIILKPRVSPKGVHDLIRGALHRNAEVDARRIAVDAADGTVTLRGNVASWSERWQAESAAWAAPGVAKVRNELSIQP
jgi:osmotically-inducible protein OsmY